MRTQVSTQEFPATDRQKTILDSIDGLQYIQRGRRLNPTEQAALEALEKAYVRTVRCRDAVVTHESIRRPVAIAQAAIDAETAPCAR